MKTITRPYHEPDFTRLKSGDLIYNSLSPEELKENLQIFYSNLFETYKLVLHGNFPKLAQQLLFFKKTTKIIIEYDLRERYDGYDEFPLIAVYYLKNEDEQQPPLELIDKSDSKIPRISSENYKKIFKEGLNHEGENYTVLEIQEGILDFIFKPLPMLDTIYELIMENITSFYGMDIHDLQ